MKSPTRKVAARRARHRALAAVLTTTRQRAGMTQRKLAEQLARAHSFVAKVERGSRPLKVWELVDYAGALHVDAPHLLRQVISVVSVSRKAKGR